MSAEKLPIVAFGPSGSYLFFQSTVLRYNKLPKKMKADIMSPKAEDKATVFGMRVKCCTLGPSKSYFIIFQRSYNSELLYSCDKLPKNLEKWLYQADVMQRDLSTLEVALGPGKSYFARDATSFSYDGIPKPMDALVEQMGVGNVKRVSLGKKGAFFFLGGGDTAHCDLRGYYSKSAMAGSDPKYSPRWKYMSLSQFESNDFLELNWYGRASASGVWRVKEDLDKVVAKCNDGPSTLKFGGGSQIASTVKPPPKTRPQSVIATQPATGWSVADLDLRVRNSHAARRSFEPPRTQPATGWSVADLNSRGNGPASASQPNYQYRPVAASRLSMPAASLRPLSSPQVLTPAQQITMANNIANRDFMVRQQLQSMQYNNQIYNTTMQNITTMADASMINSAIW